MVACRIGLLALSAGCREIPLKVPYPCDLALLLSVEDNVDSIAAEAFEEIRDALVYVGAELVKVRNKLQRRSDYAASTVQTKFA